MSGGIRILDKENHIVSVELKDVLGLIVNGSELGWSILYSEVMGDLGPDISIPVFEQEIRQSKQGFLLDWYDLVDLSEKLFQTMDILIVGCRDRSQIRRYDCDNEMYSSCDIVIQMIDSDYWEVWSQDLSLIQVVERTFKDTLRL